MARRRSDDKRNAILEAAIAVIAAEGTSAATATIAKEAGISNGSLFTYFATKADLLNDLYFELKTDMRNAAMAGLPAETATRDQLFRLWSNWVRWATSKPEVRRTLAHLEVSGDITFETRAAARQSMDGIAEIIEEARKSGPMRDTALTFVVLLMNAHAETTIDYIIRNPADADSIATAAIEALWRMIK